MGWRARPPALSAASAIAAAGMAAVAAAWLLSGAPALAGTAAPADSAAPAPGFRPADWETLYTGLPEATHLTPLVRIRYNRVDGPALHLGGAVVNERELRPLLYAAVGYAFSREGFLYDVGFDAPLGDRRRFRINGSAYRRTATEDGW